MKGLKVSLVIMVAALLTVGVTGLAYAFHSGGVAECEGCHSMHSPAGAFLLVGATQSETCLTCHEHLGDTGPSSYHISTASGDMPGTGNAMLPPKQRTPGGDFGWLRKTYTWTDGTATVTEDGSTHGHNINAPVNNYNPDPVNTTSPGGSFPGGSLACNSCHDPHGQYRRRADNTIAKTGGAIWASGSYSGTAGANDPKTVGSENLAVGVYRILGGAGYTKNGVSFPGNPAAKVPSSYNRNENATQTRAAYGNVTASGHTSWSQWCGTCHTAMHQTGVAKHPTERDLGSTIATLYGQYKKSGDLTGSAASSYLSIVPFVTTAADYTTLNTLAVISAASPGPAATDQVSCLSCHRTHASAWPHMLRFSYGYEFVTKNGEYVATDNPDFPNWGSRGPVQAQGRTVADMQAGFYGRPASMWSAYQRVLCNKCHAKD